MRLARRSAGQFGYHQKRLTREHRRGIDHAATAICQEKRPATTAAIASDAVRVGEREKRAGRIVADLFFGTGRFSPPLHHCTRIFCTARAIAPKLIEAMPQIDVIAAQAAFGENGGDICSEPAGTFDGGVDHHARKPRRQRERAQFTALLGNAAVGVGRTKLNKEGPRFAERRLRWRIEKRQF